MSNSAPQCRITFLRVVRSHAMREKADNSEVKVELLGREG